MLNLPYSRAINPITMTNWEGKGVKPDIETTSEDALETAELRIMDQMISSAQDESELFRLKWDKELLKAMNHPVILDSLTLKSLAGVYGDRVFTFENGKLYYQRRGRPKFEMEAMSATVMKGKGNTYFKIEFMKNSQGRVNEVKAYYQDNRVEISERTK